MKGEKRGRIGNGRRGKMKDVGGEENREAEKEGDEVRRERRRKEDKIKEK